MPGFDGTGPAGRGPMTGGGRGYCAMPLNTAGGRFFGPGAGRGRRNCFYATGLTGWMRAQAGARAFGGYGRALSKDEELAALKNQAAYLKDELDAIQASIKDLEKQ